MQVWEDILSKISSKISTQNFDLWFRPTSLCRQDTSARELVVWVPNQHFRYWLTENYADTLGEALDELGLDDYKVSFSVLQEEPAPKVKTARKPGTKGKNAELNLNDKYTFETFVVGFSNQFAHAAAMAVAEQPSRAYNPLFIYGGVGLGKTHLMHAIGHRISSEMPRMRLTYMSSERFMNELIHSIRYDKMIQFRGEIPEH